MRLIDSPITEFVLKQRTIYVKRDELLSPEFSGNKARKLAYYLENPPPDIDTIISYGGAQSNLMYSLSCLAKLNGWHFTYYSRPVSEQAMQSKEGNLAESLANGMELITVADNFQDYIQQLNLQPQQTLIRQGGAQAEAEYGIAQLASEINDWAQQQNFKQLAIMVASGTGATALYLQKHLPKFTVYTTNCVGTPSYLHEQFMALQAQHTEQFKLPTILPNLNFRFALPDEKLFATITQINQLSQIEFDLIYDPVGWQILLDNLTQIQEPILYLHCGGLQGNLTMHQRYQYYFKKRELKC